MYISLADSWAKGFRKWADAHPPDDKIDDHGSGGDAAATAASDVGGAVSTQRARAHRP